MSTAKWENNEEIKIFREYLRIPTVHPNVDYSEFQWACISLWGCDKSTLIFMTLP